LSAAAAAAEQKEDKRTRDPMTIVGKENLIVLLCFSLSGFNAVMLLSIPRSFL
jgi:hypothetical protein